jgi:hypothetical protein
MRERKWAATSAAEFTDEGAMRRPEGFRQWVFVGTTVTPNEMNKGKAEFPEFHHVYMDRAGFAHYKRTGTFRDGTVMIKELAGVASKQASSGAGYFPGGLQGLFASVKSRRQHPEAPGNWGFYGFGLAPPYEKTAEVEPVKNCVACHQAAAAQDLVFTQHYPVLKAIRAAAGGGESR